MLNAAVTSASHLLNNHSSNTDNCDTVETAKEDHVLFLFGMSTFWRNDPNGQLQAIGCTGIDDGDWQFDLSISNGRGQVLCLSPYDHVRRTMHLEENEELLLNSDTGELSVRS